MRIVLLPGVPALLPAYAGLADPVADLRAACLEAVAWLGPVGRVLASSQGAHIAVSLRPDGAPTDRGDGVLVVANGSAKRTEKAPGHLDDRARPFDDALDAALRAGDTEALAGLDLDLADALWADVRPLVELAALPGPSRLGPAEVLYDDDPFGVRYWVLRWETGPQAPQ